MNSLPKISIVALLSLVSCGICKKAPVIEYRDSVRIEYRDRIIHDTTTFTIEKEAEKVVTRDTASHLENKYASSDAVVSDGLLHHSLESKPQIIKVPYTVVVQDTVWKEKYSEQTIKEVEKKLSLSQSLKIKAFYWMLLVILFLGNIIYFLLKRH